MSWQAWQQSDPRTPAQLVTLPDEALADSEVVIAVERSAINYKDALALTATAPIARCDHLVLGIDLAGTVVSAPAQSGLAAGAAVFATGCGLGERWPGGLATRACCPGEWLHTLPHGTTSEWAMGLGTAGLTAWLCVERLRSMGITPERGAIAVTGASGGVGSISVALLAAMGYTVHAITGADAAHELLRDLGATEILSRDSLSPGKALQSAHFAAAVDTVGGEPLASLLAQIDHLGAVAACGNAAGMGLTTTVAPFILRGVALLGVDSTRVPREQRDAAWQGLAEFLPPSVVAQWSHSVALDAVAQTAELLVANKLSGRCIVRW